MRTKIRLQIQETTTSCTLAVMAMLLDMPQQDVRRWTGKKQFTPTEMLQELKGVGIWADPMLSTEVELDRGNIYIVAVPAIQATGKMHVAIVDFRDDIPAILDPAMSLRYVLEPSIPEEYTFDSFVPMIKIDGPKYEELIRRKRKYLD